MLPEEMLPKLSPLELRLILLRASQAPLGALSGSRGKGMTDLSAYEFRRDRGRPDTIELHCLVVMPCPAHLDCLQF